MKYEKVYVEAIEKDLKSLNEKEFDKLDKDFEDILDDPNLMTKRVKGAGYNIRRIKHKQNDNEFRLLIFVDDKTLTVYGLAYKPRKDCYKKNNIDNLKKLAKALVKEI